MLRGLLALVGAYAVSTTKRRFASGEKFGGERVVVRSRAAYR